MRDDDGQRVLMVRADMDEMNIQSIDVRCELGQGVEPGFNLTPVVFRLPEAREFLHRRELHALRGISYQFALGPVRRGDATTKVRERLIRSMKLEGMDGFVSRDSTERRRRWSACNHGRSPEH